MCSLVEHVSDGLAGCCAHVRGGRGNRTLPLVCQLPFTAEEASDLVMVTFEGPGRLWLGGWRFTGCECGLDLLGVGLHGDDVLITTSPDP